MQLFSIFATISLSKSEWYTGAYPEPGRTKLEPPDFSLLVTSYIDSGASTRVYSAMQVDRISSSIPREVAIKCISTRIKHLQNKLGHEFMILKTLGSVSDLHVPKAYYVSEQWSCGGSHKCQFLVMTKSGPDFSRIVSRNTLGLPKAVTRGKPGRFELFAGSVGLGVIAELEKLHKAGAIHGDIGRYNVANDLHEPRQVMLIDFGQSKRRSDLGPNEFARRVERDYRRANAFILRLIKISLEPGGRFSDNPLFSILSRIENNQKDLKPLLSDFILREFGERFSGSIIY